MNDDAYITLDEAAERIFGGHVTAWTLKAEIKRGHLKAYKLGRKYFTTPRHARELMECLKHESQPDSTCTLSGKFGSSVTAQHSSAQVAVSERFKPQPRRSKPTSGKPINH